MYKKLLLSICFFLVVSISFLALAEEQFDFRKTRWGMSRSEVIKSEKDAQFIGSKNNITVFKTTSGGLDASLIYAFTTEDKLMDAVYFYEEKHSNFNLYIEDFLDIKEILTKKYGAPIIDDIEWKRNLYKDNPDNYGMAVAVGDLEYFCSWITDRTRITLMLSGDNYEVNMTLGYRGLEYMDELEKEIDHSSEF